MTGPVRGTQSAFDACTRRQSLGLASSESFHAIRLRSLPVLASDGRALQFGWICPCARSPCASIPNLPRPPANRGLRHAAGRLSPHPPLIRLGGPPQPQFAGTRSVVSLPDCRRGRSRRARCQRATQRLDGTAPGKHQLETSAARFPRARTAQRRCMRDVQVECGVVVKEPASATRREAAWHGHWRRLCGGGCQTAVRGDPAASVPCSPDADTSQFAGARYVVSGPNRRQSRDGCARRQ